MFFDTLCPGIKLYNMNMKKKNHAGEKFPKIDSFDSRQEWENECWKIISCRPELLKNIITPKEKKNIILRAVAIQYIKAGKNYRDIGSELFLCPQTVYVLRKSLGEQGYRSYKDRSKTERKIRKIADTSHKGRSTYNAGRRRRTKYGMVYIPGI